MTDKRIKTVKCRPASGIADLNVQPGPGQIVEQTEHGIMVQAFMRPPEFIPWSSVAKVIYERSEMDSAIIEWQNAGWKPVQSTGSLERDGISVGFQDALKMNPRQWEQAEKKRLADELEAGKAALARERAELEAEPPKKKRGRPKKAV